MKKLLSVLLLFCGVELFSQNLQILVDTPVYFATPTNLKISFSLKHKKKVQLPFFNEINEKFEFINAPTIQVTDQNGAFAYNLVLNIIFYEDSVQNLPQFKIICEDDTLLTPSISVFVQKIKLDSSKIKQLDTSQIVKIFDIKPPFSPKFTFVEFWLLYGKYIYFALVLIVFVYVLANTLKDLKTRIKKVFEKPKEPAHIVALKKLQKLKEQELIQKGEIKEFYSQLSLIFREYLENRFKIDALESTTTEILVSCQTIEEIKNQESVISDLKDFLFISDLAKFAKFMPTPDTCYKHFNFVENFVNTTKVEEQQLLNQDQNTKV